MRALFSDWRHDERGQDLIEYALLAAFIAFVGVMSLGDFGSSMSDQYARIGAQLLLPPGSGQPLPIRYDSSVNAGVPCQSGVYGDRSQGCAPAPK